MYVFKTNVNGQIRIYSHIGRALEHINGSYGGNRSIVRYEVDGNSDYQVKLYPSRFGLFYWDYKTSDRSQIKVSELNSYDKIHDYLSYIIKCDSISISDNYISAWTNDGKYETEIMEWMTDVLSN